MSTRSTKCKHVRALLSAYIDRRLPAAEARAVSLHLARCAHCADEEAALVTLGEFVRALPADAIDPDTARRVRSKATGRSPMPRRAALAVAAVLLLATGAALGYRQGKRSAAPAARGVAPMAVAVADRVRFEGEEVIGDLSKAEQDPATHSRLVPSAQPDVAAPDQRLDATAERPRSDVSPRAQLAAHLPDDPTAIRASESIFADLELLASMPVSLHRPLLATQVRHFGLERWAAVRSDEGPRAVRDVAVLVQQLVNALESDLNLTDLGALKSALARPGIWSSALAAATPDGMTRFPSAVGVVVSQGGGVLPERTRDSLRNWVRFKEDLVQGERHTGDMFGLLDSIPSILAGSTAAAGSFALPDLDDLFEQIEWTVDAEGNRRGELHVEERTQSGSRSISVLIERR